MFERGGVGSLKRVPRRASRGHEAARSENFCVFYPIELKLCTMIELFIPNNRIVFVFLF